MNRTRVLRRAALALVLAAQSLPTLAANSNPVIFVHGFAGFGRSDLPWAVPGSTCWPARPM